jgi:cell division septum initiation protein DivIVA
VWQLMLMPVPASSPVAAGLNCWHTLLGPHWHLTPARALTRRRAWASGWEESKRAAEYARLEAEAKSVEAQLRRVRHENGQMEMVRAANEDEIARLKGRLADMVTQVRETRAPHAA